MTLSGPKGFLLKNLSPDSWRMSLLSSHTPTPGFFKWLSEGHYHYSFMGTESDPIDSKSSWQQLPFKKMVYASSWKLLESMSWGNGEN